MQTQSEKIINKRYMRKGTYSIQAVLSKIIHNHPANCISPRVNFDGDLIKMGSIKYRMFAEKGLSCVACGLTGQYFAKEKLPVHGESKWQFHLYAINNFGDEVMITKDHIIPKSKGGKNELSNLQPMCKPCNEEKGNQIKQYRII